MLSPPPMCSSEKHFLQKALMRNKMNVSMCVWVCVYRCVCEREREGERSVYRNACVCEQKKSGKIFTTMLMVVMLADY